MCALCLALVLSGCWEEATPSVERPEELIFHFVFLNEENFGIRNGEPIGSVESTDYTVILSERDAATLGSETESQTRTEIPGFEDSTDLVGDQFKFFTATNFVDLVDNDGFDFEPPCFEDPVMIRDPSGEESELLPAGYCNGVSWIVEDLTINAQD